MHILEMEWKIKKKSSALEIRRLKLLQKILRNAAGMLSSAVIVLANRFKIYDQSKAVFFQLNLHEIHGVKG